MSALTPLVPATKTWLWLLRSDCLALQPLIRGAAGGGGPGRAGREHRHQHDQTDNNWHRLELPLPGPALVLGKIIYLKQINPAVLTLTSCSLPALSPADTGQEQPGQAGDCGGSTAWTGCVHTTAEFSQTSWLLPRMVWKLRETQAGPQYKPTAINTRPDHQEDWQTLFRDHLYFVKWQNSFQTN